MRISPTGRTVLKLATALLLSTSTNVLAQSAIDPSHYRMPEGGYYMPDPANPLNMLRTTDLQAALTAWRNDPEFSGIRGTQRQNWGPRAIGAELMYALGYTGQGQSAGVIDTGSDEAHPEFQSPSGSGNVTGIDTTFTRTFDDISERATEGFNRQGHLVTTHGGIPSSGSNHGTHVMGLILGQRNGFVHTISGVPQLQQGVAYNAHGYAIQGENIGPAQGPADTFEPALYSEGMRLLTAAGVSIINNSWGMNPYGAGAGTYSHGAITQQYVTAPSRIIYDSLIRAAQNGVVSTFAAGNDYRSEPPEVNGLPYFENNRLLESHHLTVLNGNQNSAGVITTLSASSNVCGYSSWYCVVAPGQSVLAAITSVAGPRSEDGIHVGQLQGQTLGTKTGTSMASPTAAGAFLLIKERFPYLTNAQVLDILKGTANRDMNTAPLATLNAQRTTLINNGGTADQLAAVDRQIAQLSGVNRIIGLGTIDLATAARGPRDLLNVIDADMNVDDLWSNNINQDILDQRRRDETAEIAAWPEREQFLTNLLAGSREEADAHVLTHYQQYYADNYAAARALVETLRSRGTNDIVALNAVLENATAREMYQAIGRGVIGFGTDTPTQRDAIIAAMLQDKVVRSSTSPFDPDASGEAVRLADAWAETNNANKADELRAELAFMPTRIAHLRGQTYEAGIIKRGTGELELSGENTYLGDTIVRSGSILLSGSSLSTGVAETSGRFVVSETGRAADVKALGGRVVVNGTASYGLAQDGGILSGTGTLASVKIANAGILAPGNSVGTLKVLNDLMFEKGSIYQVELDATGADRVDVGGTATLGGTLAVTPNAEFGTGAFKALMGKEHDIITASNTTGTFDTITPAGVFVSPIVTYTNTVTKLKIDRNGLGFVDVAVGNNQKAVATVLDTANSPFYDTLLFAPNASFVQQSFASLTGEINATGRSALVNASHAMNEASNNRLRSSFGAAGADAELAVTEEPGVAFWSTGLTSWGKTDGNANTAETNLRYNGILFGADTQLGGWQAGVLAGFGGTSFSTDSAIIGSGSSSSTHLGVYGGTEIDNFAFRTGLTSTWSNINTSRTALLPAPTAITGGTNGHSIQAYGELGYGFDLGDTEFEPFANLSSIQLSTDGFTETGGAAALTVDGKTETLTFTTIGVRAEHSTTLGDVKTRIKGTLGWRHAFGDTPTATQAFASSNRFTVSGAPIARDAALVEAGVDFEFTPEATFGIGYSGQFAEGVQDHSLKAALSVKF
jgi:subtilase-type serine protease